MADDDLKDLISQGLKARDEERRVRGVRKARRKFRLMGLERAQAWALGHFNANRPADENGPLDPPSSQVVFDGEKMTVSPQLYGRSFGVSIEYVYSGAPMGDCWVGGVNPLTGGLLPILWVSGAFFEGDDESDKEA